MGPRSDRGVPSSGHPPLRHPPIAKVNRKTESTFPGSRGGQPEDIAFTGDYLDDPDGPHRVSRSILFADEAILSFFHVHAALSVQRLPPPLDTPPDPPPECPPP
jgi:hypothetical protein